MVDDIQTLTKMQAIKQALDYPSFRLPTEKDATGRRQPYPDYLGPVAVRSFEGAKGRGLVATRDISKGELLLVEQVLGRSKAQSKGAAPGASEVDVHERAACTDSDHELVQLMVREAQYDGELLRKLNYLDAGEGHRAAGRETALDVGRIRSAVLLNCLGRAVDMGHMGPEKQSGQALLFHMASLMNHACDANVVLVGTDEYLAVRAMCDIAAGEEVVRNYALRLGAPFGWDSLKSKHGFECSCKFCLELKAQPKVLQARREVKLEQDLGEITDAGERLKVAKQVYKQRGRTGTLLNCDLIGAALVLSRDARLSNNLRQSISYAQVMYEITQQSKFYQVAELAFAISSMYQELDTDEDTQEHSEAASKWHRIACMHSNDFYGDENTVLELAKQGGLL